MKLPNIFQKIPHSLRIAILVVLLAKVLVFSLGYATTYLNEGPAPPLQIVMNQFTRWDSPHYIDIAKNWYVAQGEQRIFLVFFPLYPILIRLSTVDLNYINLSALLVSNISSIIGFTYLFKLAKFDFDDNVAKKAVLYLSIFPTAYFLSAPYTEGLFFALTIASIYYARSAKWPLAGILSLFATLTRLAGLLLLPVLFVEYFNQKEWKLRRIDLNTFWLSLAVIGFLIYLNINNQVSRNPFMFMYYQQNPPWYNTINPLLGLTRAWGWVTTAAFPENITIGAAPLAFGVVGLLAILAGLKLRFRLSYNVYMLFTWLLSVSTGWWISVPRYVLAMFPMFILFGLLTNRKIVNGVLILCSAGALCFFTVLFAMGQWAF
jgi:hypothetical protein